MLKLQTLEFRPNDDIGIVYAKQHDLDKLTYVVESLSEQFSINQKNYIELSMNLTRETTKFSLEVSRLSNVLTEMNKQMEELLEIKKRRQWVWGLIEKSPKLIATFFFIICFSLSVFTTNAHKDIMKFATSYTQAKLGVS